MCSFFISDPISLCIFCCAREEFFSVHPPTIKKAKKERNNNRASCDMKRRCRDTETPILVSTHEAHCVVRVALCGFWRTRQVNLESRSVLSCESQVAVGAGSVINALSAAYDIDTGFDFLEFFHAPPPLPILLFFLPCQAGSRNPI